jgi:hypothetical protein
MTALLIGFGYTRVKAGKTGGSRVRFDHRTSIRSSCIGHTQHRH